ncbi:MAG: hypothetical protein Q9172_005137 [Xanthocarpia lactea]
MDSALVNTSQSGQASVASGAGLSFNQFLAASSPPFFTNTGPDAGQSCANEIWNIDVTHPPSSWPCTLDGPGNRKRRVVEHKRPYRFPHARTYSATYNDNNGSGYNITLPGHLCASTIVGDYISPAGNLYYNATMATIHNSLAHLSPLAVRAFTTRSLVLARRQLYDALKPFICDPHEAGARALLFRYEASDRTGECCYGISAVVGTMIIAAVGMLIPTMHPGATANWSGLADYSIGVTTVTFIAIFNVILDRLRRPELRFQELEADTLNFFIAAKETIVKGLKVLGTGVCMGTAMLWTRVREFCARSCLPGLRGPIGGLEAGDGGQAPGDLQEVVVPDVCPAP